MIDSFVKYLLKTLIASNTNNPSSSCHENLLKVVRINNCIIIIKTENIRSSSSKKPKIYVSKILSKNLENKEISITNANNILSNFSDISMGSI